jgi:ankyrin repeat protein
VKPDEIEKVKNKRDEKGNTLAHYAVAYENVYIIDKLDNNLLIAKRNDGNSAVHIAVILGNKKTILALLRKDVPFSDIGNRNDALLLLKSRNKLGDLNHCVESGMSALHWAVIHNFLDIIQILVSAGVKNKTFLLNEMGHFQFI